jgi:uncharacterized UPF0160 family protein
MKWAQQRLVRLATHGAPQHLDELAAICLLRNWVVSHGGATEVTFLARGAVEARANEFDVLIDIGHRFDPEHGRFDHHQGGTDVAERASVGLVFDTLYANDPRRSYLEPIIRHLDAIDTGRAHLQCAAGSEDRGPRMVSVSAMVKAIGGFHHDPAASRRCLEVIEPLVDSWFRQAEAYLAAPDVVSAAERVAGGILLNDDQPYGPGLLEYVQRETDIRFVGFPGQSNCYKVVAVRDASGDNRVTFSPTTEDTVFVHPRGFMAVFPDRVTAARSLESG